MTSRERMLKSLSFEPVDKAALEVYVTQVGLYEHGEKLRELFQPTIGDFGPIPDIPIPAPPPGTIDSEGQYLEYTTDGWGAEWVCNIFCGLGHPVKWPLENWSALDTYRLPPAVLSEYDWMYRNQTADTGRQYFKKGGWVSLLERLCALRPIEEIYMDLSEGGSEINKLADMIAERHAAGIELALQTDIDAIQFADDYGTQISMLVSPELFRSFFKPRYAELIKPIKAAGKKVLFHCCGYSLPIFEDLKEIGVDAIWPQLNVYGDLRKFADYCRSIELAVAIHPERSELMTNGTPDDIRRMMAQYADAFQPERGGSWLYLEIDTGFPFKNIETLASVVHEMRR